MLPLTIVLTTGKPVCVTRELLFCEIETRKLLFQGGVTRELLSG
nr:MAG TPA: hypothetical protein [Caudoviricetes sp.]